MGVLDAGRGIDPSTVRLEHPNRIDDRLGGLVREQHTCRRGRVEPADGLEHASARQRDDRRSAGLRFQRGDAEILIGREDERSCLCQPAVTFAVWQPAEQARVRARDRLDPRALGAFADHHQLAVGKAPEGLDDQVDALVGDELRNRHVGRPANGCGVDRVDRDRRMDDGRIAAVAAPDAIGDVAGDRDEVVDPSAGLPVPRLEPVEHAACEPAPQTVVEPGLPQVLVAQVPCIAHRRVAVADVQLSAMGTHALGHRMRAGDHQVVGGDARAIRSHAGTAATGSESAAGRRGGAAGTMSSPACPPAWIDRHRTGNRPARKCRLRCRHCRSRRAPARRRARYRASRGRSRSSRPG